MLINPVVRGRKLPQCFLRCTRFTEPIKHVRIRWIIWCVTSVTLIRVIGIISKYNVDEWKKDVDIKLDLIVHCMLPLSVSSQNGFRVITYVVVDTSCWKCLTWWSLVLNKDWYWLGVIVTKQEALKCKDGCFCYLFYVR